MTRCIVIVLDSGGIGALPDAQTYGDAPGANTIGNVAARVGGLNLPNFGRLGLGSLTSIRGVDAIDEPAAYVARLGELSKGKDTITGHWEMAGIRTVIPFPTFPDGFPPEVIEAFTAIVGDCLELHSLIGKQGQAEAPVPHHLEASLRQSRNCSRQ